MRMTLTAMMKLVLTLLVFSALVVPLKAQSPCNLAPPDRHADVELVTRGINEFALKLYAQLRNVTTPNVIVSPYSASIALSMTQSGARGETAGQIASVLNIPTEWDRERVESVCGELIKEMTIPAGGDGPA